MFSKDSILYQVNVISKVIGLILTLISIILIKIPSFVVLLSIVMLIISANYKYTFRYSLVNLLVSIIASFYPPLLWISKIMLFINYTIIVKKITKASDLRYVLEVTLYKFQSRKITYHILYIIYYFKYLNRNYKLLGRLKDEYGIKNDWFFVKFRWKKAKSKTKNEMNEFITMNSLRFYNYSSNRTYIEKPTWERWDSHYVIAHVIMFVFIIIYGGIL